MDIIQSVFAQPGVDDTDGDRGRIPAAENQLRRILNSKREEDDEDTTNILLTATAVSLTAAALRKREAAAANDDDSSDSSVSSVPSSPSSSRRSSISSISSSSSSSSDESDGATGGGASAAAKAAAVSVAATVVFAKMSADDDDDFLVEQAMHDQSYDKNQKAPFIPTGPPVLTPWLTQTEDVFKKKTGGWFSADFLAMIALLTLMPSIIVLDCGRYELAFGVFVLLRRWVSPVTWKDMQIELQIDQTRLCKLGNRTLDLLCGVCPLVCAGYLDLIGTIDIARIELLIPEWNEVLTADLRYNGGPGPIGEQWVIGFIDGRCQACTRPGTGVCVALDCVCAVFCIVPRVLTCTQMLFCDITTRIQTEGDYASWLAAFLGCSVNLVQRAFYNGNYCEHGAKIQHFLQADGT